jgi:hypothetical protein
MKFKLKDVHSNPFRDMDRYPIHPQKIEQLKRSIESTSFWDNVVARHREGGGIEIAYGHHRLVALRALHGPETEFDWIVRDLDDKEMLKIMAHENLDEWGHDSGIERETVRAVVKAFAEDRIFLPKPAGNTPNGQMRYAPSFCFGTASEPDAVTHPYTADTIVGFLGGTMSINTVKYTLRALCLIEEGHIREDQLKGLSSNQSREVVDQTATALKCADKMKKEGERKALKAPTPILQTQIIKDAEKKADAVVKQTSKAVSETLQKGGSVREAKSNATKARVEVQGKDEKELPEINDIAKTVASSLMKLLDPNYVPGEKLVELIKFKQHLSPSRRQDLDRALEIVIEYAEGYRVSLSK